MSLRNIKGIGSLYEKKLNDAGIKSIEELALADAEKLAEESGISIQKIKKWKEEAKTIIGIKKAEIAEDISKISFIEIRREGAKVKIKEAWHSAPVYRGKFNEIKEMAEKDKIAVYLNKNAMLWFNGNWYKNIPFKDKTKSLFSWLRRRND